MLIIPNTRARPCTPTPEKQQRTGSYDTPSDVSITVAHPVDMSVGSAYVAAEAPTTMSTSANDTSSTPDTATQEQVSSVFNPLMVLYWNSNDTRKLFGAKLDFVFILGLSSTSETSATSYHGFPYQLA